MERDGVYLVDNVLFEIVFIGYFVFGGGDLILFVL